MGEKTKVNRYLQNLSKLEFVVTYACTGRCKHCSEGEHTASGICIDPAVAADTVQRIATAYPLQTVMAFGGEPLLYPESVYAILRAARDCGVPKRQVITNGYFSKNADRIREVAETLAACGINDLLLSVDAFHQETIPLETVQRFAAEAKRCGIPIRLQPAWLVSREDNNPYNKETRRILAAFSALHIAESAGNVVFPEGNALRYLGAYMQPNVENPYREDPTDVRCISVEPNGDTLGGNICLRSITDIMNDYAP